MTHSSEAKYDQSYKNSFILSCCHI